MKEHVTVWLKQNGMTNDDINFLETVITFASMVNIRPEQEAEVKANFARYYPEQADHMHSHLSYTEFRTLLQEGSIALDPIEVLERFKASRICPQLCSEWLAQATK